MRKTFFVFFLVLLSLALFSCGGGGGGGNSSSGGGSTNSSTPVISNLSMSPNQASLNQGGGAVTANMTFNFIDTGGDLSTFTVFYYDKNGATISKSGTIQGASGITSGSILVTMAISTTERGTTTGGVFVTDAGGRESNRLTGTFTVN